jgi:hypothetical protein
MDHRVGADSADRAEQPVAIQQIGPDEFGARWQRSRTSAQADHDVTGRGELACHVLSQYTRRACQQYPHQLASF